MAFGMYCSLLSHLLHGDFIQVHQEDEVDLLVVAEEGELVEAEVVVVRVFSKLSAYLSYSYSQVDLLAGVVVQLVVEDEVLEGVFVVAVVEAAEAGQKVVRMSLSSHTDIQVYSLPRVKSRCSSQEISFRVNLFMVKNASLFLLRVQGRDQVRSPQKSNIECGILSGPSWLLVYWGVWKIRIFIQAVRFCTLALRAARVFLMLRISLGL